MSDRFAQCRCCGHEVHDFALDDTGRCGGCKLDAQRRWDYRAEQRATVDLWPTIRSERDLRLMACDWTQLADVPDATRIRWQPYRQALRDITTQTDPAAIQWPDAPNGDSHD